MVKCGICGKEVKEQPKITSDGKCSICGKNLMPCEAVAKEVKKYYTGF